MRDAADQVFVLFPDCAPDRHIIKATVEQPAHRHMRLERRNCLTDAGERGLHLVRFRDKIWRSAAEQAMIQDTAVLWRDTQHGQGAIAWHERLIQRAYFH